MSLDVSTLHDLCQRMGKLAQTPLPEALPEAPQEALRLLQTLVERCEKRLLSPAGDPGPLERMKSEFLMGVSHELRTPLASVEGFATALLHGMDPKAPAGEEEMSPETRRKFLEIISQEAARLGELIEDVLRITELEARPLNANPSRFNAQEIFLEAVAAFRSRWRESWAAPVEMKLDPAPGGPFVYANREAVREMLRHLLDNAHKYSEGAPVVLGAEAVAPSPGENGATQTRFWVQDRGVGIARAEQTRIFSKFHRIPSPGPAVPGTGLGLAIVKTLVLQNKGRVSVKSDLGKGATFEIRLPNQPSAWKRR